MHSIKLLVLGVGILTFCSAWGPLVAPVAAQETTGRVALEEIIVTARKREESLLSVPISINAFLTRATLSSSRRRIAWFDFMMSTAANAARAVGNGIGVFPM